MTQTTMCAIGVDATTGFDFGSVRAEPDMNCDALWRLLEIYNDSTRRIGRETGTKVIDLDRLLPREENSFYDMVHFLNPGAAAVGEIVASSLAEDLVAHWEAPSGNSHRKP